MPLDSKTNATRFLDIIHPSLVLFIKYDFWFYYFSELKSRNIPLFLVSAIFKTDSIYLKKHSGIFRETLSFITHMFVQDQQSLTMLRKSGFNNTSMINDTRIDRVFEIASSAETTKFPEIEKFIDGKTVLILGSSYQKEEIFVKKLMNVSLSECKIIVVPHHTDEKNIRRIITLFDNKAIRYSDLINGKANTGDEILIIDKIGILSSLYKYANIAFIGGGFNKGVHNTLEPACFGIPVITGAKNHEKFMEIIELKKSGGIFIIKDFQEFSNILSELLSNKQKRETSESICKNYISNHTGGTNAVLNELESYLKIL